ncbi:MAG: hypothetical protein QGG67_05160 [Gammaproteobacteria bacterium]|jgi:hypothetical protein|nr:hypothetical protein [Gammaproteobacteria bacterium]|tara:strand:- start:1040 stop:1591 length:552 start_codon:yes stop_codon:yes gene_type:complete
MNFWLAGFCCLALIATSAVSANQEQTTSMQSSLEDFKEFSQAMQGRWISEIVWINDWPGFGKRGDTEIGYTEFQIAQNGRVMTGRGYAGPGSDISLTYYDVGKGQIFQHVVSSGGNVWTHIIYKENDEWNYNIMGSTGDGKEITGSAIRYISDQGQTHRWLGEMFIDGEKLDPLRDSFRRIGD